MGWQCWCDRSQNPADEAIPTAGPHDDQLRPGRKIDEGAGGVSLLGHEIHFALVSLEVFAFFGKSLLGDFLPELVLRLGRK
ncbi:hypothetical protein BSP239C_00146 [Brevibacterium sp. 239c]|nr:hypothetical protein BSP239C_00146 [Brevibacterium sp. 239c]